MTDTERLEELRSATTAFMKAWHEWIKEHGQQTTFSLELFLTHQKLVELGFALQKPRSIE